MHLDLFIPYTEFLVTDSGTGVNRGEMVHLGTGPPSLFHRT